MVKKVIKIKDLGKYDLPVKVNTPDGWVEITNFWDRGIKRCLSIKFKEQNKLLTCTLDHKIQLVSGDWVESQQLKIGDQVLHKNNKATVVGFYDAGYRRVFDIEVNHKNHRFYADGVSVHNCVQANRAGYKEALNCKDHLYSLLAISDYNEIERASTIILSLFQDLKMRQSRTIQIQNLKNREGDLFPVFKSIMDGSIGHFYENKTPQTSDDIVDIISSIEI